MQNVVYYLKSPLSPGRPSRIITRKQDGIPCSEFRGYYRPDSDTVVLYPAPGSSIYGYLPKHEISIYLLIKDY